MNLTNYEVDKARLAFWKQLEENNCLYGDDRQIVDCYKDDINMALNYLFKSLTNQ